MTRLNPGIRPGQGSGTSPKHCIGLPAGAGVPDHAGRPCGGQDQSAETQHSGIPIGTAIHQGRGTLRPIAPAMPEIEEDHRIGALHDDDTLAGPDEPPVPGQVRIDKAVAGLRWRRAGRARPAPGDQVFFASHSRPRAEGLVGPAGSIDPRGFCRPRQGFGIRSGCVRDHAVAP